MRAPLVLISVRVKFSNIGVALSWYHPHRQHATQQKHTGSKMPSDIDPQSGFRLPLPKREDLDEAGKRAYDRAASGQRSIVGLRGPAGIQLYSTKSLEARNTAAQYLR